MNYTKEQIKISKSEIEEIDNLTVNEHCVLIMRLEDKTLRQIALHLGLSPERIRQIEAKAVMKIIYRDKHIFTSLKDLVFDLVKTKGRALDSEVFSLWGRCEPATIRAYERMAIRKYLNLDHMTSIRVESLNISNRLKGALSSYQIRTVGGLERYMSIEQNLLSDMDGIGKKGEKEIKEVLEKLYEAEKIVSSVPRT